LIYCDNTKQELETLNLVAQRNIPVTVHQSGSGCNQRHMEPPVEPRIMKAIPVHAQENRRSTRTPANKKLDPQRRNRALPSAPPAKSIRNQQKKAE
jgi:hypothetical protein